MYSNCDIEKMREEARDEGRKEILSEVSIFLRETYFIFNASPNEWKKHLDEKDYTDAKEQIAAMQTFSFGAEINVLLVTDRLFGCAKGLQEYMQNSKDIAVDLVNCFDDAKKIIDSKPIDFLIVVGYLEHKANYNTIKAVKKINKYSPVIMYAALDICISQACMDNGIRYKFHRREPISNFIEYMRQLHSVEMSRFQTDYPSGTTMKEIRDAAIKDEEVSEQLREQAAISERKKEVQKKLLGNIGAVAAVVLMVCLAAFAIYYEHTYGDGEKSNPNHRFPFGIISEMVGKQ